MNFASIPDGTRLFIDANIFVYWFADDPALGDDCRKLFERIEAGTVHGVISSAIFNDIAHRLMTLEACEVFGWSYVGIARSLRRHRSEIHKLTRSRQSLDKILAIGIRVLDVTGADVTTAADLSRQFGLLSGDGLILAAMQSAGLTALATNDTDFNAIPGITVYTPI